MWENIEVTKNKYGFYQLDPIPSEDKLASYYHDKYYQNSLSTYRDSYEFEELEYIRGYQMDKLYMFESTGGGHSFFDIGCGEGFALKFFHENGWEVHGVDFSSWGISRHNADMLPYFVEGDLLTEIGNYIEEGDRYDIVNMDNVLEHVVDPQRVLMSAVNLLADGGRIFVNVPNDFNPLQKYLYEEKMMDKQSWVTIPDHISYFNREGLISLAADCSLEPCLVLGTELIEVYGLAESSNYFRDSSKGRDAHVARRRLEKILSNISIPKKIELYKALGEMGLGRNLIALFKKANK